MDQDKVARMFADLRKESMVRDARKPTTSISKFCSSTV